MTEIGLRIDVDTFRGTRDGVPRLIDTLARHGLSGTFYFSLGPDNMGRHLWRLFRPAFLKKILRSRGGKLYGWDILLAGTCWPGRKIGARLGSVVRDAAAAGHEVGLHAWDHYRWQRRAGAMSTDALYAELEPGFTLLCELLGHRPHTSAAAGWICNIQALAAKERFGFAFNSDCRGTSVFVPSASGTDYAPQVPTTMPTYDELIGRDGVTNDNYNERLLTHVVPGRLNVLTIHAEVEGIACATLFEDFILRCRDNGFRLVPLGQLPELLGPKPRDGFTSAPLKGRDGDVAWQGSAVLQ
jgi:undecaprenyl phosphate-alpha-L-ara4FN deformylase